MNSIPNLEKTRPATCENAFSTMSAGGESTQPTITTQAKALQLSHSTKLESFLIPSSGWHHSRPQGFSGNQTASGRTVTYRLKFFTPVFINVWLMRPSRESFRQSLALGNGQNRRKKCFFTFFYLHPSWQQKCDLHKAERLRPTTLKAIRQAQNVAIIVASSARISR